MNDHLHEHHPAFRDGSFAHLPLGWNRSAPDSRTLQMMKYVSATVLPTIPSVYDLGRAVPSYPMYGNDRLGDCTCAAVGHMIQAWTKALGKEKTPTDASVETMYWETGDPASSHGSAGGDTDNGRDELSILGYWQHHGLVGDKITAYGAISPQVQKNVEAGIYLFGGLYTGVALPITAQSQQVWDVVGNGKSGDSAPGSWGGHAVPFVGYDATGVTLVTWGGLLKATWRFVHTYFEEAYAIISPDWLNAKGQTIDGFNMTALTSDLAAIRH